MVLDDRVDEITQRLSVIVTEIDLLLEENRDINTESYIVSLQKAYDTLSQCLGYMVETQRKLEGSG